MMPEDKANKAEKPAAGTTSRRQAIGVMTAAAGMVGAAMPA